jgi:hypothetical protein
MSCYLCRNKKERNDMVRALQLWVSGIWGALGVLAGISTAAEGSPIGGLVVVLIFAFLWCIGALIVVTN